MRTILMITVDFELQPGYHFILKSMRHPSFFFTGLTLGTLAVPIPLVAHAEIYLTEEQACSVIFPGPSMTFKPLMLDLNPQEISTIESRSHETVRHPKLKLWLGPKNEVVLIDQVLGKHEFITFALGITSEGAIKQVEILEYRETYGSQVRKAEWRSQFTGKTTHAPLKLNEDIKNLSGATLSSAHVTAGVRRLLFTYDVIHAKIKK